MEFTILPNGQRVNAVYELLTVEQQNLLRSDPAGCMDMEWNACNTPIDAGPEMNRTTSFLAIPDTKGYERRLKLSRITTWERKCVFVDRKLTKRTDLQCRKINGCSRVEYYVVGVAVQYGRDEFEFDLTLEEFDKKIEEAGGKLTR